MESALIVGIIQLIIREAPGAINGIRALLNKDNPTDADFDAARERIAADTFGKLAPDAANFRVPPAPAIPTPQPPNA